jgi:hypothetical protein
MWDLLFDWPALAQRGADAVGYLILAVIGTGLFALRLVLGLFGGNGGDLDADVAVDSDASFTLFSLLSVTAFVMGAGWMGLAARIDWGLGRVPALALSVGFGAAMMVLAAALMSFTRRLNRQIDYDLRTAIGRTGRSYLRVPARGAGQGQVEVSVSGRLKVLTAISNGGEIPAFTDVRVVDVRDDETLVVEPLA